MLTTSSYIYDYVTETAKFFNEFDRSNFITNANIALDKMNTNISLSLKGNHYSNILEKTISHINEIEIDSYAVSEFVTKILGSGRIDSANLNMKDIAKNDPIVLKPQYLNEAVLEYKEVINGIASGKYTVDKIRDLYTNIDAYITTLKKRLVSSNINVHITSKEMIKYDNSNKVDVTTKYLEDEVLPFLQNIPKKKKELTVELTSVNSIVHDTLSNLKKLMEDVSTGISLNKIDDTQKRMMLQYTFNQVRAILEGVSFITYAALRKVHQFEDNVIECQNVYNALTLLFNDAYTLIESGAFDTRVISPTEISEMADKLADGDNDIFVELSHNIIEYHKGYLSTHLPESTDIPAGDAEDFLTTLLSNHEFNPTIYNNIVKAYIEIGNGLEIIAKNCDDRLMIFDELIDKAGFALTLSDRFLNEIESLDDLSVYGLTDLNIGNNGEKNTIYYMILSEINGYPKITKQIADVCRVIRTKAEYVEDLFTARKNNELAYSESLSELKIFLDSFKDQFKAFNCHIVKGLYKRLKELATKADDCTDNVYPNETLDQYMDDDFFKEAMISNLDEIDALNDIIMESLLKEYYAEREFKERGVRLVYEAENTKSTVIVNDNSNGGNVVASSNTGKFNNEKLQSLLKTIGEWFEKMITSFEDIIGRQAAKNKKWLADNKDALTSRSYSNVQIQILPYEGISPEQITKDISTLANNVNSMNVQNIQNIKSYEDIRTKLITFGPKFGKDDEKVTITNYYKSGNRPLNMVQYSNNNIKTLVVNIMIPYCENFYDSYKDEIKKQLTAVKTAAENISKIYVSESVSEIDGLVFTEAEDNAPTVQQTSGTKTVSVTTNPPSTNLNNNDSNKSTTESAGLSAKAGWIKQCIQMYSGSVLNSIRDRNNDYFKVLYALAPKTQPNTQQPAANTQQ